MIFVVATFMFAQIRDICKGKNIFALCSPVAPWIFFGVTGLGQTFWDMKFSHLEKKCFQGFYESLPVLKGSKTKVGFIFLRDERKWDSSVTFRRTIKSFTHILRLWSEFLHSCLNISRTELYARDLCLTAQTSHQKFCSDNFRSDPQQQDLPSTSPTISLWKSWSNGFRGKTFHKSGFRLAAHMRH